MASISRASAWSRGPPTMTSKTQYLHASESIIVSLHSVSEAPHVVVQELAKEHQEVLRAASMVNKTLLQLVCYTEDQAADFLSTGVAYRGRTLSAKPAAESKPFWVSVKGLPLEYPATRLAALLSNYGTILVEPRNKVWPNTQLPSLVRECLMFIERPIPSKISLGPFEISIKYYGQVQLCWHCEQEGHLSRNCPEKSKSLSNNLEIDNFVQSSGTSGCSIEVIAEGEQDVAGKSWEQVMISNEETANVPQPSNEDVVNDILEQNENVDITDDNIDSLIHEFREVSNDVNLGQELDNITLGNDKENTDLKSTPEDPPSKRPKIQNLSPVSSRDSDSEGLTIDISSEDKKLSEYFEAGVENNVKCDGSFG